MGVPFSISLKATAEAIPTLLRSFRCLLLARSYRRLIGTVNILSSFIDVVLIVIFDLAAFGSEFESHTNDSNRGDQFESTTSAMGTVLYFTNDRSQAG